MISKLKGFLRSIEDRIGADQVELYYEEQRGKRVEFEKGLLVSSNSGSWAGVGVRVIADGGIGYASTSMLNSRSVLKTAEKALRAAKLYDGGHLILPQGGSPLFSPVDDRKTRNVSFEDLVDIALNVIERLRHPLVKSISGKIAVNRVKVAIVNSNGVELSEDSTSVSVIAWSTAVDGDKMSSSYSYQVATRISDIDVERLREATENAVRLLDRRKIDGGSYTVIFSPDALASLVGYMVSSAVNGENVYYKRSFLAEKIGEEIASNSLTIIDDPHLLESPASRGFDDEGVITTPKPIVRNGVLTRFLYNSEIAYKAGVETTGNAYRRGYSSQPGIAPVNLCFEGKILKFEDLLSQFNNAIYIKELTGAFTSNTVTGDFSVIASAAFLVDGELAYALKPLALSGNILNLLKNYVAQGDDFSIVGGWMGIAVKGSSTAFTDVKISI